MLSRPPSSKHCIYKWVASNKIHWKWVLIHFSILTINSAWSNRIMTSNIQCNSYKQGQKSKEHGGIRTRRNVYYKASALLTWPLRITQRDIKCKGLFIAAMAWHLQKTHHSIIYGLCALYGQAKIHFFKHAVDFDENSPVHHGWHGCSECHLSQHWT